MHSKIFEIAIGKISNIGANGKTRIRKKTVIAGSLTQSDAETICNGPGLLRFARNNNR
jgi:hypothetical protein